MTARREVVGNENAWVTLRETFAPFEMKLVSSRPQRPFKATRLVTPVGPLLFVIRGELIDPGADVNLAAQGVQFAHVGDLVVFEVHNTSARTETLDCRVYGIALRDAAQLGDKLGEVGLPGSSGLLRVGSTWGPDEETKP